MRVLSNIAERATGLVDGAAARWLERLGGDPASLRDITVLRRLLLCGAAGFVALPAALSLVVNPAIGLPLGAAGALVSTLAAASIVFALQRPAAQPVSEAETDELLFSACPGVVMMLDPQARVLRTGGRDLDTFPKSLRDREGETLAEIIHVSDRIALLAAIDRLRQGAPKAEAEIRVERPVSAAHGRQFLHMGLDLTALRDAEGGLVRILALLRDRSAEEILKAQAEERRSEASSAHEAKSRFLAAVSHEMRTPLNAILGFSDVLAGEYFGRLENDRQREYVGLIRQSGAHLLSVVNTMLDMSRIEAGRYELMTEHFAIADAVETCRAMLDHSAREKGLTLTARVSRTLGEVVADRRAVQQILINLAGNAIKFTGGGGVVSIDAVMAGEDFVITVSDTGIGMAADKLALIGQPFMQVDNDYARRYDGTGLGLSLVKGLVALHGGRFAIASRPGEGTVVTIALPADGAGANCGNAEAGQERVEFPPRLMVSQPTGNAALAGSLSASPTGETRLERGFSDGAAEAKIA